MARWFVDKNAEHKRLFLDSYWVIRSYEKVFLEDKYSVNSNISMSMLVRPYKYEYLKVEVDNSRQFRHSFTFP